MLAANIEAKFSCKPSFRENEVGIRATDIKVFECEVFYSLLGFLLCHASNLK